MSNSKMVRSHLSQLEWYLLDRYDVHVSFDKDGTDEYWYDPENFEEDRGVISINSSKTLMHQLYVLLHESGHVILRADPIAFKEGFPDSCRNTLPGRLEILREEVLAWEKASEVAERLGIKINQCTWKENYRDALEKYVKWVLDGDNDEK